MHVQCHFQPLPTELVFAYFDRASYIYIYTVYIHIMFNNWHLIFAICVVPKYLLFLMPSTLAPSQGRRATSPMVGKRVGLLGWEFTLILVG